MCDIHDCAYFGTCVNNIGSYECDCVDGYKGDGLECSDINECEVGTANCDPNASCLNVDGSYSCSCVKGFFGNGKKCEDVNECKSDSCDLNAKVRYIFYDQLTMIFCKWV